MKRLIPLILLAAFWLIPNAKAATYYVASGATACSGSPCADTNNGISKTTAWAHAPGMQTCTNTCASTTIHSTDSIILRGGDTWTNANFQWSLPNVGTGSSSLYVGVDKTWFAGGSFARPILTGGGTIITTTGHIMVSVPNYTTFDNFEITGYYLSQAASTSCPAGLSQCTIIYPGQNTGQLFENLYIHGWTHDGTDHTQTCCIFSVFFFGGFGVNVVQNNVIDGSDVSGDHSVNAFFNGPSNGYYNYVNQVSSAAVVSLNGPNAAVWHDNVFTNIGPAYCNEPFPAFAGNCTHENGFEDNADIGLFFYNNNINTVNAGLALWLAPEKGFTAIAFNNVIWNVADNQILDVPAPPIYDASHCTGTQGGRTAAQVGGAYCNIMGSVTLINNTVQCGNDTTLYDNCQTNIGSVQTGTSLADVVIWQNNHFITAAATAPSCYTGTGPPVTCTITTNTVQTLATANGQGYNSSQTNAFSPTAITNATVGNGTPPGTNATSLATGVATPLAASTTYACTDVSNVVTCPALATVPRPGSGGWENGAYAYTGSGGTCANPTYNNGTGTYTNSVAVTITEATCNVVYCTDTLNTCTPGTSYSTPVTISTTGTYLRSQGTLTSYTSSGITSALYTITNTVTAPAPAVFTFIFPTMGHKLTLTCACTATGALSLNCPCTESLQ